MFIWQPFPSTRLRVQFCLFSFKSVYFSWIKLSSLNKVWVGGLSFPINLLLCLMLLLTRQQSASNFGKIVCACVCVCARSVLNPIQCQSARISSFQWHKKFKKKYKCFNNKTNKSVLTPAANNDAFHSGGFWASYGFCAFPGEAFKSSEEFQWFTLCLIPAVEGLWCQVVIVLS